MELVISVKNRDIKNWRAAGEFAVTFSEALLAQTGTLLSDEVEELFLNVKNSLEEAAVSHDEALLGMREMVRQAAQAPDAAFLEKIVEVFQSEIFSFFNMNRSATAYFRLQSEFHQAVAASVVRFARAKLGATEIFNRPLALIALGEGGRGEFSLKNRLQLLLVHDDALQPQSAAQLGEAIHGIFAECGLLPDTVVTPRHDGWRFGKKELLLKLTDSGFHEHPELLRIVDQRLLYDEDDFGAGLRDECLKMISDSRNALLMLIAGLHSLNSGIGLLGGVKLEKSGPGRGKFRLHENALQPLADAVTVLSLLKGEFSAATPDRIRGLLSNGHLNVDTAERLLNAWHNFNEHRIVLEAQSSLNGAGMDELYLDYASMEEKAHDEFRYYLETISGLLRHVFITCNSWEESR